MRIIFLAALVFFCYANSFSVPFLWDDEVMVVGNPLITSWSHVKDIFLSPAFGGTLTQDQFFRPIQILSYVFDYSIWGLNPFGFHLTSVLIHLISVILLFFLLKKIEIKGAWIVAALFAVHPIHIESVTYISGRGDVLYVCLSLGCFLLFLHRRYFWACVCFGVAVLAKENAIVVPFLISGYVGYIKKETGLRPVFTILGLAFAYLVFRFWVLPEGTMGALSWISDASFYERVLTLSHTLFTYLRLLIVPYDLHMEYHFVESSLWGLLYLIPLGVAAYFVPRFWVFWFLMCLAPVLNIVMPLAATLREHWAALASIAVIIALSKLPRRALVVYGVFLIVMTIARNQDWQDPRTLYQHDLNLESASFVLHNNLGVIEYRDGNYAAAKNAFENSISTSPGGRYGTAHNNLGVILEAEGKIKEAEDHYQKSIDYSQYPLAYENLERLRKREIGH